MPLHLLQSLMVAASPPPPALVIPSARKRGSCPDLSGSSKDAKTRTIVCIPALRELGTGSRRTRSLLALRFSAGHTHQLGMWTAPIAIGVTTMTSRPTTTRAATAPAAP